MDTLARLIGYCVMAAASGILAAFLIWIACFSLWTALRDARHLYWLHSNFTKVPRSEEERRKERV